MPRTKDPLARDRRPQKVRDPRQPPLEVVDERRLKVWQLRTDDRLTPKEISKKLKLPLYTVYQDLNDRHSKMIAAYSEYGQHRRKENEGELEKFKAMCASYLYNPNVVIRGEQTGSDGKTRVVELSKFEAMLKVAPLYLAAINIQNKVWGLYTVPDPKACSDAPGSMNIKNVSIQMVEDLRRIARNENLALPAPIDANDARPTDSRIAFRQTEKQADGDLHIAVSDV